MKINSTKNYTPNQNKSQQKSRANLLEQTQLSRLPPLPRRDSFTHNDAPPPVVVAVCGGCGGRLESDNDFQQSVKVCRKCLAHYAKIDAAIDESLKQKKRELLEKMAGGGND